MSRNSHGCPDAGDGWAGSDAGDQETGKQRAVGTVLQKRQRINRKSTINNPSDPIVAMTAHAMKGDRERCLEAGVDDYITKPIKREVVFEALERWVFSRQG